MNKQIFTLIAFLLMSTATFSQTVKTGWGELNKNEKKMNLVTTFGSLDAGLYSIYSGKGSHCYIEKFTGNAKLIYSKELIIPTPSGLTDDLKFSLDRVLYINNTIYLFTTFYNSKTDTRYLFVNTVDKDGNVSKDMTKLDEVADVKKREGNYMVFPSDDSTKICISNPGHNEKNEKQKLIIHVIDLQLKDIWNKEIQLPYTEKQFRVTAIKIDNDGNAFIAGSDKLEGDDAKGKFDYKFVLASYTWQSGTIKEYDIDLGDKYMNNFYFTVDKDNNIRASGFYANKNNNYLNGYFYLLIDTKTQSVSKKVAKDFDANFLKDFPKKKDLKNVETKRFYIADNGSLNIIAEQDYTVVTPYMQNGHWATQIRICSDNVIILNLSKEGNLNWEAVIPKRQEFMESNGIGTVEMYNNNQYALYSMIMPYKNSIYIAYNDVYGNNKKTNPDKLKKYTNINKTEMVIVKVDEKGKVNKQVLEAPDKKTAKKTFIITTQSSKLSTNQYSFISRANGKDRHMYRIGIFDIE